MYTCFQPPPDAFFIVTQPLTVPLNLSDIRSAQARPLCPTACPHSGSACTPLAPPWRADPDVRDVEPQGREQGRHRIRDLQNMLQKLRGIDLI